MSSADPRRPEKVQGYKQPVVGSAGNPNEDLTPDYMNILGPDSIKGDSIKTATTGKPEANTSSNIIPTSPQYGVAILPNSVTTTATNDVPLEVNTQPVDTITDSLPRTLEESKDVLHSTPSKNDRFKVVKIASSEPFRRGRWKCMDYVDQTPTVAAQPLKGIASQAQQVGGVYMQTQSLPPQQIQQLLLQGGYSTAAPQFYQGQIVPQSAQFFYPPPQMISGTVPTQFVTAGQSQQYFTTPVPQSFPSVQFVQPYQGAFVPTTQQYQHQTYSVAQSVAQSQPQPVINGFTTYTPLTQTSVISEHKPTVVTSDSQHSQNKIEPTLAAPVSVDVNVTNQPTEVYTNPQFVTSVHNVPIIETTEIPAPAQTDNTEVAANPDDPGKTNPVVNAIDNKIEQAMDLVKSHLMYTVREEVEVLKEKIAELMERIQQLESENNFLRSQLPKSSPIVTTTTSESQPPPSQIQ